MERRVRRDARRTRKTQRGPGTESGGKHRLDGVSSQTPPTAKKVPSERVHHGDTVVDDYAWLTVKDDPETVAYLEAENAYTNGPPRTSSRLQETIFQEIKDRTLETDLSVPTRKGGWWYYSRTEEGKQYGIQCRRGRRRARRPPELRATASRSPGEEVLLDGNELAGDTEFFALGTFDVSPDGTPAGLLHRLHRRRALHPAGEGPRHRRDPPRRDPRHLLRRRLVRRRLDVLLHDGRRRLAAQPGLAAHDRHPGRRGRARPRGDRRAVLGRRRAHPLRALPRASTPAARSPARSGILDADDPDRRVRRRRAPPAGRRVRASSTRATGS